VTSLIQWN